MGLLKHILKIIDNRIPRASFARNIGILAGGTALAQAVLVLSLPLITRIYTPADFSILAVYAALLGMIGVVACLRFEIAIPLPEDDAEAVNLMILGLIFATGTSVLVLIVVAFCSVQISQVLGRPELQKYLLLLPVGVWLTGVYACVQYWATRSRKFTSVAKSKLSQATGSVSIQILFGLFLKLNSIGLILAQIASVSIGLISLGKAALVDIRRQKNNINKESLVKTYRKYSKYPKFSTIESLANTAAIEIPVIIVAATAIGPEAGYAFIAMKAGAIPLSLIGNSISQVYLSRAPAELRAGNITEFTQKIIENLVAAGVGPLVFIGLISTNLVPLFFGQEWSRTGEIITWMTPWFVLQFLASPISMALHVAGQQKIAMCNQIWGLVLRCGMTLYAAEYYEKYVVEVYAISGALFYAGYFYLVCKISNIKMLYLLTAIKRRAHFLLMWVFLAGVLKIII